MKGKRVAVYCRVDRGSDPERQRDVLTTQREQLRQYAAFHGLQIAGYYQDAGYSGHDLNRPGLNQMTADYKAGKFEAVLIVNRTRLFRGSVWGKTQWPFPIISLNQLDQIRTKVKER